MNDDKKMLLELLTSGNYEQITGRLARMNAQDKMCFCAEGLVLEVAHLKGFGHWEPVPTVAGRATTVRRYRFMPKEAVVDVDGFGVEEAEYYYDAPKGFGITEDDLEIMVPDLKLTDDRMLYYVKIKNIPSEWLTLYQLNDQYNLTFPEIAELLSAKWGAHESA